MDTRTKTTTPSPATPASINSELDILAEKARDAVETVGPHVYKLNGINTEPVRFFVIGCHGNGGKTQKETAALMHKIAQDLKNNGEPGPSFILFLGDNIYDYGVGSPFAEAFNECFHAVYNDPKFTGINNLPCFILLGNHDFNYHSKAWLGQFGKGYDTAVNQAAHTFISNTANKITTFNKSALTPPMLSHWNMPYYFYSIIAGETQIFLLDSNNYLVEMLELLSKVELRSLLSKTSHTKKDLLELFVKKNLLELLSIQELIEILPKTDTFEFLLKSSKKQLLELVSRLSPIELLARMDQCEKFSSEYLLEILSNYADNGLNKNGRINQAYWFKKEYDAAIKAGRQVFIAQHHPLFVSGKRAFPKGFDAKHYISQEQINALNAAFKSLIPNFVETESYNDLIASGFLLQKVFPDLVFVAHEHSLSYMNNCLNPGGQPILRQVTSGGGGGDLQKRCSYKGHPYFSMFQKHNGFFMTTCDPKYPKKFVLDAYTIEGLHLRFDQESHEPIMLPNKDVRVEMLRKSVIDACDRYFGLLKKAEIQLTKSKKNNDNSENSGMLSSAFKLFSEGVSALYNIGSTLLDHLNPNDSTEIENSTIHDIQAYFCQYEISDWKPVLTRLFELTRQLPYRTSENDFNFYPILNSKIKDNFGKNWTMEKIFADVELTDLNPAENQIAAVKM